VTPAQREAMKSVAAEAGLSVSALICTRTLGIKAPPARRRTADVEALVRTLAALGRSGGNLNQICRRLNAYDFGGIPELQEMRAAMLAVQAEHRAIGEQVRQALTVAVEV
jgi:hypothetical protein